MNHVVSSASPSRLPVLRPHATATADPFPLRRTLAVKYQAPLTVIRFLRSASFHVPLRAFVNVRPNALAAKDIIHNAGATAAVLGSAYALVFTFDSLTQRNLLSQNLNRKLVHIISGLLFALSWPIFSNSPEARYFAALVPLVNCLRLIASGLSLVSDDDLLKSLTREGKPQELLRGPLYYVLILAICAIFFWRESPAGLVSLAMMCGGDGMADIMGRRYGSVKLPYNQRKSWVGSISMFVMGFLTSMGMLYYYSIWGYLKLGWVSTMQWVAWVSLVSTVVESLPTGDIVDDNISVPLISMAVAVLSFSLWDPYLTM